MWPFEPTEESLCFLRGLLELMTEAKKINIRYIFDLKSHVIAKRGNCSKEIAGRWKNNSMCQICLQGVVRKVSKRKNLTGETFFLLEKRLLSTFKRCASSNLFFFTSCWLAHNQLSLNVLLLHVFPVIRLVNFV